MLRTGPLFHETFENHRLYKCQICDFGIKGCYFFREIAPWTSVIVFYTQIVYQQINAVTLLLLESRGCICLLINIRLIQFPTEDVTETERWSGTLYHKLVQRSYYLIISLLLCLSRFDCLRQINADYYSIFKTLTTIDELSCT